MGTKRECTQCKHFDIIASEEPCYSCLYGKERPNFEPKADPVKKAKIVGRLSSWQYTIGYVQGILVESDIKDKSATDLLKGMAADIEGFVSDVLNDME